MTRMTMMTATRAWRIFEIVDWDDAIDFVEKSLKSGLSLWFLGRLKFSVVFRIVQVVREEAGKPNKGGVLSLNRVPPYLWGENSPAVRDFLVPSFSKLCFIICFFETHTFLAFFVLKFILSGFFWGVIFLLRCISTSFSFSFLSIVKDYFAICFCFSFALSSLLIS